MTLLVFLGRCTISASKVGLAFDVPRAAYAGHSKWQNIRHTKAANDSSKSMIAVKIARKVRLAVRAGGSPDPKLNAELARAIAQAKSCDIPKQTVDHAIKQALANKEEGSRCIIEAKGPGGCFLLMDCFTDKPRLAREVIQSVLKKFGGSMLDGGAAAYAFEEKGLVTATKNECTVSVAEEDAIRIGAEDVTEMYENDDKQFQFVCDPPLLGAVRDSLQLSDYVVVDVNLGYVPKLYVKITKDRQESVTACLDKLEESVESLRRIYDNIEFE